MKTPHTSCQRGKRVFIKMKDGTEHRGRFLERRPKHVVLENATLWAGDIRSFTIDRREDRIPNKGGVCSAPAAGADTHHKLVGGTIGAKQHE